MRQTKVLVCIAGCESSRTAFYFACAKARSLGAILEALTVVDNANLLQGPFTSQGLRSEEMDKAKLVIEEYTKISEQMEGLQVNFTAKDGDFEDTIIKTINSDSDIVMLIIGFSVDTSVKHHHATALLSKLGKSLMIPVTIVPGNLTRNQIAELNGMDVDAV